MGLIDDKFEKGNEISTMTSETSASTNTSR